MDLAQEIRRMTPPLKAEREQYIDECLSDHREINRAVDHRRETIVRLLAMLSSKNTELRLAATEGVRVVLSTYFGDEFDARSEQ